MPCLLEYNFWAQSCKFKCNKYKYVVFIANCSVKSIRAYSNTASLDLGFFTGLSLCLQELLGSALVTKEVCLTLTKGISFFVQ